MEDISRELEREIARSKPKPYRKEHKTRLLIVDDFGQMKSGEYLKTSVKLLSVISVICFAAAVVLFYLYSGLSKSSDSLKTNLAIAQKKVRELTQEKEILMAKLVISGDKLDGVSKPFHSKPLIAKKQAVKPMTLTSESAQKKEDSIKPEAAKKVQSAVVPASAKPAALVQPAKSATLVKSATDIKPATSNIPNKIVDKTVTIENFMVTKVESNNELLVRFDIKKISDKPGDVAGRIFTVLHPDDASDTQKLVVPTTSLKNGIPFEYSKGQYFSIAHFKPVKFRIKNQVNPELYKKASIFIFNDQEDLIFEKLIDITEAQ